MKKVILFFSATLIIASLQVQAQSGKLKRFKNTVVIKTHNVLAMNVDSVFDQTTYKLKNGINQFPKSLHQAGVCFSEAMREKEVKVNNEKKE